MYYQNYRLALDSAIAALVVTDGGQQTLEPEDAFDKLVGLSEGIQKAGGKQFLAGNGASAAFANHMALDWTKNGRVVTQSFSDSATLTAVGNDLGFEQLFAAPLGWYGGRGDLLLTISSSGNSPNIIAAIQQARKLGMRVVTFSGLKADNRSRSLGDLNFYIPAKTYGIVECAHQVLLHIWIDRFMGIQEWDREEVQNMRASEFNL